MNRAERRARRVARGRGVWVQPATCSRCGEKILHVELSPYDDEPYGLPAGMRCDCGGEYVAARRAL